MKSLSKGISRPGAPMSPAGSQGCRPFQGCDMDFLVLVFWDFQRLVKRPQFQVNTFHPLVHY